MWSFLGHNSAYFIIQFILQQLDGLLVAALMAKCEMECKMYNSCMKEVEGLYIDRPIAYHTSIGPKAPTWLYEYGSAHAHKNTTSLVICKSYKCIALVVGGFFNNKSAQQKTSYAILIDVTAWSICYISMESY